MNKPALFQVLSAVGIIFDTVSRAKAEVAFQACAAIGACKLVEQVQRERTLLAVAVLSDSATVAEYKAALTA